MLSEYFTVTAEKATKHIADSIWRK